MARSAFKLKSGNISGGSSFKQIGSSPMKLGWLKKGVEYGSKLYKAFKYGSKYADEVSEIVTKGTNKMKPFNAKGGPRGGGKVTNVTNETVSTGTSKMKSELSKLNPRKTTTRFKVAQGAGVLGVIGSVIAKDGLDGSTVEVGPIETEVSRTGKFSDSTKTKTDTRETYE